MVETLKKMMNSNFQGIDVVDEATAKMKLEITSKPIASDEINHPVLQLQMEGFGRAHCKARQAAGKQLEDSGVLSDSLRSRSNSLGLHMPLVYPDGAVVAYAWKRQLAGQAGAAVDRTSRIALGSYYCLQHKFLCERKFDTKNSLDNYDNASRTVTKLWREWRRREGHLAEEGGEDKVRIMSARLNTVCSIFGSLRQGKSRQKTYVDIVDAEKLTEIVRQAALEFAFYTPVVKTTTSSDAYALRGA
ncbi:hypothetical protein Tco_0535946 [Tanacetum coccineum]